MALFDDNFNNAFFSLDEFASEAEFKLNSSANSSTIKVNFFKEGDEIITEGGAVEVVLPVAICLASDVTGAKRGISTLIIDEVTYYVTKTMPDGEGITVLYLSEQAI